MEIQLCILVACDENPYLPYIDYEQGRATLDEEWRTLSLTNGMAIKYDYAINSRTMDAEFTQEGKNEV
ncbi:MAG: hypothetical protein GTO14_10150 [Anaerolineales bacterium]|nr:hypothetical protein [Anaerolineales bacterium]